MRTQRNLKQRYSLIEIPLVACYCSALLFFLPIFTQRFESLLNLLKSEWVVLIEFFMRLFCEEALLWHS